VVTTKASDAVIGVLWRFLGDFEPCQTSGLIEYRMRAEEKK
jgi:hypothetical protein